MMKGEGGSRKEKKRENETLTFTGGAIIGGRAGKEEPS